MDICFPRGLVRTFGQWCLFLRLILTGLNSHLTVQYSRFYGFSGFSRNNLCLLKFIKIPTILVYSSQHINILYIDNSSYPTDPSIIQTLEINYCKVLTTLTSLSWNYLISSALQACSTRRGARPANELYFKRATNKVHWQDRLKDVEEWLRTEDIS